MKRFLIIGAVLLLGLNSCIEPQVVNPNFDPETNSVNTQFVFNIAAADELNTKQLGQVAQVPGLPNSAFRGMVSATLFTFARGTERDGLMILDSTEVAENGKVKASVGQDYVDLSTMILKADLNLDSNPDDSRRILQISLPTGTNGLLFYGLAGNTYSSGSLTLPRDGLTEADEYGLLESDTPTINKDTPMSAIGSHLVSRLAGDMEHLKQVEGMFLMMLNKMMLVGVNGDKPWNIYPITGRQQFQGSASNPGRIYDFGTGTNKKKLTWADYAMSAESNDSPKSPLPKKTTPVKRNDDEVLNPDLEASPMEKILGNAYTAIATFATDPSINIKEIRAGSANAILRQFKDLYSIFQPSISSTPVNTEEMIAQDMMIEILKHIAKFTDGTVIVADNGTVLSFSAPKTFESLSEIHNLICPSDGTKWDASLYDYTTAPPAKHPLKEFPQCFNLPQGAVVIKPTPITADNENMFAYYVDDIDISDMGHVQGQTMSIEQYTYPAPLTYYGNSPIRVNNSSEVTDKNYANGYADWAKDSEWDSDWSISHVTSSTRGVAMKYNIQYGVALFKQQVKFSDAVKNSGKMYDNNDNMHPGEAAHEIPITGNSSIVWTGIMIGGQPNSVGWDYLTKSKEDKKFTMMIYDRALGTALTTPNQTTVYYNAIPFTGADASEANYTLVYDNFSGTRTQADQNKVYCALEFVNRTGKDFWGIGGIVRDEGTFYLIAELSPWTDATKTTLRPFTWPDEASTGQIVPPFKEVTEGGKKVITGEKIVRVFVQDFMTEATFVLNQNSLKRAYVTVPDLKSSKISLGLSVDLNWQSGLKFETNLGQITEPTN